MQTKRRFLMKMGLYLFNTFASFNELMNYDISSENQTELLPTGVNLHNLFKRRNT